MATSQLTWAGYTFDVVSSEVVGDVAQLAQHALEDGTDVADHRVLLPTSYAADVIFSDIPGDGTPHEAGRADRQYLALLQEWEVGTVDDLVTSLRVFPQMVLNSITRRRSSPEGAARMSLRWDPIRTYSGEEVAVPIQHTSTVAAGTVNTGKVDPVAPAEATTKKATSILEGLLGG